MVIKQTIHPSNSLSDDRDAIIALCTPLGQGAIALLRISGDDSIAVANNLALLSSGKKLVEAPSHTIHHGFVVDGNLKLDEVLFLVMHGPRTFTGQNTIEISCHNNQFIIEQLIACAVKQGARHAKPGEFTRRAFLNNKIDLVQAEAINDIIHASSELSLKKAQEQLEGSLSKHLTEIEHSIVELLSLTESCFEFLEEEQRDLSFDSLIKEKTNTLLSIIHAVTSSYSHQQHIKEGIRISLIGSVNAGKSTLFNCLVKKNRAIVSSVAGTTRDSIEASIYKNGHFLTFVDTAGLRDTNDCIEQEGIKRSYQEAEKADIILLVFDSSRPLSALELDIYMLVYKKYLHKTILIANKSDQSQGNLSLDGFSALGISAHLGTGLNELEVSLAKTIATLFEKGNTPYLLNQRQYSILTGIESDLNFIANSYSDFIEYEIVAYQLRDVLAKVSELTGKAISESILDTVFSKFCIGK